METENKDWKPEVGGKAWTMITIGVMREVVIVSEYGSVTDYFEISGEGCGSVNRHKHDLYPTAKAAISGIRIFDLDGKEVVVTRDSSENEQKMRGFLAKRMQSKQVTMDELMFMMGVIPNQEADAINKIVGIAYNIELAPNPEGSAHLKAAQERFASLAAGNEDPADPSAREITTPTDKRNGDHC